MNLDKPIGPFSSFQKVHNDLILEEITNGGTLVNALYSSTFRGQPTRLASSTPMSSSATTSGSSGGGRHRRRGGHGCGDGAKDDAP